MKKSIQVIVTAFAILLGNIGYSQSDSVYIVKGDSILAVYATTEVDSIIFYRPNTTSSGGEYVICDGSTFTWNDVTNPTTGRTWMDRNLGASQVATSWVDENAYGDLYQWGRGSDGHQCRNPDTTSTLSSTDEPGHNDFILSPNIPLDWRSPQNNNLWQGIDGINNPCPSGYRIPTKTEWEEEIASWTSANTDGAYGSILKLPLAGNNSPIYGFPPLNVGTRGNYWSSTVTVWSSTLSDYFNSKILQISSSSANVNSGNRAIGASIRCIKD